MPRELLPINTRVTHFDGGPSTHGKGTIVEYNGIPPNGYRDVYEPDSIRVLVE